jgi:hypothetical protein
VHGRLLKLAAFFLLTLFVLPLSLRAVLYALENQIQDAYSYEVDTADMSSIGLLPEAADHPAARVMIMSVPLSGQRGKFLTHSWVVLKRENARSWSRYEVLGFASRDGDGARNGRWLGNRPTLNRYAPDGHWFGRRPAIVADAEGATAAAMIPRIEAVIENYETTAGHYRTWPGPNSNTFVASVLRAVPELRACLPPTAIGKDFRPGVFAGFTDSRTGVEADLWGVFGVKIGWIEGLEFNFLSFIAGLDLRQPALKLPGFGQIGLAAPTAPTNVVSDAVPRNLQPAGGT